MDDQTTNTENTNVPANDQSGRRDFIKKLVMAGAVATPVVLTFARGVRSSQSVQKSLDEAVTPNTLDGKLLNPRAQAHFQNAVASRPALVMSNTTCKSARS